ncbi:thioesterase family protein [Falsarthrobacter nasiphocae]|uniref:Thioesterase family protein n=1 Tax=Falsarthrobacter nasiphocae TaxID=189863 RepID=A0AAE4C4B3_9MICC|nr:thioesterase family protein [Falsarthrobacter nasiphocae]MDR6891186.1 hypothetical protein [Falsarthrobacter nasiphocae]
MKDAMYRRTGEGRFASTIHAQGAWNPHEQHMGPASGLLAHEIERFSRAEGLRIARLSYDILGLMAGGDVSVTVEMERPGRTIQLVRAEMTGPDGRPCLRARAWLLATTDTEEIAGLEEETMPHREECDPLDGSAIWGGGYIAQLEGFRHKDSRPGRGWSWVSSTHPLVEGEDAAFGEFVRDLDAANGMAVRVSPGDSGWAYPNVDLQLHLIRAPRGPWKGLDTRVSFGADGVGLTSSVVSDSDGVVGRMEQTLTLRRVGA